MTSFILSVARAPQCAIPDGSPDDAYPSEEETLEIGTRRISVAVDKLEHPVETEYVLETLMEFEDGLGEPDVTYSDAELARLYREAILPRAVDALLHVHRNPDRDRAYLEATETVHYFVSGGVSGGDYPTESARLLDILDELGVWDKPITVEEIAAVRR